MHALITLQEKIRKGWTREQIKNNNSISNGQ